MNRLLLIAGLLLPLVLPIVLSLGGCSKELHVISPIPRLTTDLATEGDVTVTTRPEGAWLARSVYETSGIFIKSTRLRAIEILFCPMKKNNYTDCRLGVGWSSTKFPLAGN